MTDAYLPIRIIEFTSSFLVSLSRPNLKTPLSQFFHCGYNPILIGYVLTSWCCVPLHHRSLSLIDDQHSEPYTVTGRAKLQWILDLRYSLKCWSHRAPVVRSHFIRVTLKGEVQFIVAWKHWSEILKSLISWQVVVNDNNNNTCFIGIGRQKLYFILIQSEVVLHGAIIPPLGKREISFLEIIIRTEKSGARAVEE